MITFEWEEPLIPPYKPMRRDAWAVELTKGNMPGYYSPQFYPGTVFTLKKNDTVWMSVSRMEVESHMPHIWQAHGHVVVMGLGLGFYVYNIAQKDEVERITVIEKDPDVILIMNEIMASWPNMDKVEVVRADALKWTTDEHVDYVYVDLWDRIGSDQALSDTVTVSRHVPATKYGYWGQEFDFNEFVTERYEPSDLYKVNQDDYEDWRDTLPFDITHGLDPMDSPNVYPKLCCLAVFVQAAAHIGRSGNLGLALSAVRIVESICKEIRNG